MPGLTHGPIRDLRSAVPVGCLWGRGGVGCLTGMLAALFAFALTVPFVRAEPSASDLRQVEAFQRVLADVADAVRPSVVALRTERYLSDVEADGLPDDQPQTPVRDRLVPAVGSGVVIGADGIILTNEHVIRDAQPEHIACVLSDGRAFCAMGVTSDPRSDLAVVRIDATGLKPIRMGDVGNVRQGHFAIVMGNPFGLASDNAGRPAMSFGVISALGQELTRQLDPLGERYYGNLIQTDAKISPGNSGGPLLNIRGELIGINTAISTQSNGGEGVGYAISIDKRTKEIITQLSRGEEVEYGYLGVDLDVPTAAERAAAGAPAAGGALIREIRPGTPAANADLQVGDIVTEYDGQRVQGRDHLVRMVGASRANVEVQVVLHRDKRQLHLHVRPDRRPADSRVANTFGAFSWRGMRLADLSTVNRRAYKIGKDVEGVLIEQVDPDGPAQKAGVRPGQVLRKVGDVEIDSLRRLKDIVPQLSGPLQIVLKGEKEQEVTLP